MIVKTKTSSSEKRHLIDIDDLSESALNEILDLASEYAAAIKEKRKIEPRLHGRTQINLFFEDSTRTNLSFELAGKKLGADVINVPVAASSVHKGESLIDTAQTMAAMGADAMVVRTTDETLHAELAGILDCAVINAGAGKRSHPTQALLDALTIKQEFDELNGLIIAICGDIRHSRVAHSSARLFTRLGATVRYVAPGEFLPEGVSNDGASGFTDLRQGIASADVIMALRIQKERIENIDGLDLAAVQKNFCVNHNTIKAAKPHVKIMHPGPMNRDVEISSALADDLSRSLILKQVSNGVPIRMAVLDTFINQGDAWKS